MLYVKYIKYVTMYIVFFCIIFNEILINKCVVVQSTANLDNKLVVYTCCCLRKQCSSVCILETHKNALSVAFTVNTDGSNIPNPILHQYNITSMFIKLLFYLFLQFCVCCFLSARLRALAANNTQPCMKL